MLLIALAACAPAAETIQRVTPLPDQPALAAVPTATPQPASTSTPQTAPVTAFPSPTPWSVNLEPGSALAFAAATDVLLQPTPRTRLTFTESTVPITFDEFYDGFNLRYGLLLSDKLVSLDGQRVSMEGYMAPPLKPELDYFVLTRVRLAFCPFCSTAADWPDDIALVYLNGLTTTATLDPVRLEGRLEVGSAVDQETGMFSLVRIYADNLEIIG